MNKQLLIKQILVAILGFIIRKPTVQAHISKATSLFDGVLKNIDKSLDTLGSEVNTHQDKVKNLKDQLASQRFQIDSNHDAQHKLRALKSKITDIVG